MTERTLREQIACLPRYKKVRGGMDYEDMMMVRPDGGWLSRAEVLRTLDAHTAAQPAPDAVAEADAALKEFHAKGGKTLAQIKADMDPAETASERCVICGSPHMTRGEMTLPDGQWVCSRPCELAVEAVRKAKDATAFRNLAKGNQP